MTYTGGCLCGTIRYVAEAEPQWMSSCHCSMCRKQTGAPMATYVGFPVGSVRWLTGEPQRYRSSEDVERGFCPTCGSVVTFHRVHETSLTIGSFDHPEQLRPGDPRPAYDDDHVYFADRIPWFDVRDKLPRYDERPPGRSEELEALSGRLDEGASPEDRV